MNKPKTLRQLISGQDVGAMESILQRGARLRKVEKLLQRELDPGLRPHCRLANINGQTMVLLASSTVWAARIRYQLPQLLKRLQQTDQLRHITELQLRVQPATKGYSEKKPARRASMSRNAAHCLEQCAASIEHEPLRTALQRLSGRKNGGS